MKDLKGKTAFITGGASGIGKGIAEALAAEGVKVAIADVNADAAAATARELADKGVATQAVQLDVASRSQWDRAAAEVEAKLGPVSILCSNAGVGGMFMPLVNIPIDEFTWLMDINLMGIVHGIQCFAPRMKAQGGGHIVNTASMAGVSSMPTLSDYAASKHAALGLSLAVREELAPDSIGVTALCPGPVTSSLGNTTVRQRASRAVALEGRAKLQALNMSYIPAIVAGRMVVRGIHDNAPLIFTHSKDRARVQTRYDMMMKAFDATAAFEAENT